MATFSYLYTMQATGFIDVDNIGEVALSIRNDFAQERIIIVTTDLGETTILRFGDRYDSGDVNDSSFLLMDRMQFNSVKIERIVDKFINDSKFCTTQVIEITKEEALDRIIDFRESLG